MSAHRRGSTGSQVRQSARLQWLDFDDSEIDSSKADRGSIPDDSFLPDLNESSVLAIEVFEYEAIVLEADFGVPATDELIVQKRDVDLARAPLGSFPPRPSTVDVGLRIGNRFPAGHRDGRSRGKPAVPGPEPQRRSPSSPTFGDTGSLVGVSIFQYVIADPESHPVGESDRPRNLEVDAIRARL